MCGVNSGSCGAFVSLCIICFIFAGFLFTARVLMVSHLYDKLFKEERLWRRENKKNDGRPYFRHESIMPKLEYLMFCFWVSLSEFKNEVSDISAHYKEDK